ncbi:MAG: ArsB/NhaD family transporter [Chloroflexi bacterium]|nr:ArsB/NhaD family transporter [Chloroflexota bacterium]
MDYILSGLLFLITFAGILSEKVHRTIIAMVGAALMVAVGILRGFYDQEAAIAAIDFNTLGLLLGMMILVAMLARTGFFEYLATYTAKRSRGDPWKLLVVLSVITTLASMFLDNVTTVVLIAPVTVLIAEILGINPIPFLLAEALLANTGGVATLIGDPPNILIGSAAGFSFIDFLVHLAPIVLVAWVVALLLLRVLFRRELAETSKNVEALYKLDEGEVLRDRTSLRKLLVVLGATILLFFLHNFLHLSPAFVALLGASAALLWVRPDVEEILKEVEWHVLLFFAALFVTVGGVEATGLLHLVAERLTQITSENLLLAGLAVIWISAALSAIVDNIPFTIIMIPVLLDLGATGLDITPLWWALALGAGFGGNGTPIGSTANIIIVSISGKTRHPITTRIWLRVGLPIMLAVSLVASLLYALTFRFM